MLCYDLLFLGLPDRVRELNQKPWCIHSIQKVLFLLMNPEKYLNSPYSIGQNTNNPFWV